MKAVFKDINLKLDNEQKKSRKTGNWSSTTTNNDCEKGNQGKKTPKWKLENNNNDTKIKKEGKTYHWCKCHNNN